MDQVPQPHTFDSSLSCLDACLLACNTDNNQTTLVRGPEIVPFVPEFYEHQVSEPTKLQVSAPRNSTTLEQDPKAPKSFDESSDEEGTNTTPSSKNQTSIEQARDLEEKLDPTKTENSTAVLQVSKPTKLIPLASGNPTISKQDLRESESLDQNSLEKFKALGLTTTENSTTVLLVSQPSKAILLASGNLTASEQDSGEFETMDKSSSEKFQDLGLTTSENTTAVRQSDGPSKLLALVSGNLSTLEQEPRAPKSFDESEEENDKLTIPLNPLKNLASPTSENQTTSERLLDQESTENTTLALQANEPTTLEAPISGNQTTLEQVVFPTKVNESSPEIITTNGFFSAPTKFTAPVSDNHKSVRRPFKPFQQALSAPTKFLAPTLVLNLTGLAQRLREPKSIVAQSSGKKSTLPHVSATTKFRAPSFESQTTLGQSLWGKLKQLWASIFEKQP